MNACGLSNKIIDKTNINEQKSIAPRPVATPSVQPVSNPVSKPTPQYSNKPLPENISTNLSILNSSEGPSRYGIPSGFLNKPAADMLNDLS